MFAGGVDVNMRKVQIDNKKHKKPKKIHLVEGGVVFQLVGGGIYPP